MDTNSFAKKFVALSSQTCLIVLFKKACEATLNVGPGAIFDALKSRSKLELTVIRPLFLNSQA